MRYELDDRELLLIHQEQIDYDLRELERLKTQHARSISHEHDPATQGPVPTALHTEHIEKRIEVIEAAHAKTKSKAAAIEKRLKAR